MMAMPQPRGEPETVRMLIRGPWRERRDTNELIDPYRDDAVARAPRSILADLDDARRAAVAAKKQAAALPGYARAELMHRGRKLLLERADDIGRTMARGPATR